MTLFVICCEVKLAGALKKPVARNTVDPGVGRASSPEPIPTGSFRHKSDCVLTSFYKRRQDGIEERVG